MVKKKQVLSLTINKELVEFEYPSQVAIMQRVVDAARLHHRVLIKYQKLDGKEPQWRSVAPYKYKSEYASGGGILYAEQGGRIKSFALYQIDAAESTEDMFEPQWPVEL